MSAPAFRNQFKVEQFAVWLAENGAAIGVPTNSYEVIRYRAFWQGSTKAATHIVFTKETGLLTYTGGARDHYEAFMAGETLPEVAATLDEKRSRRLKNKSAVRAQLRDRDGAECWFCGRPLADSPHNIEHLINISDGGTNALANLVEAHEHCNKRAGNLPLGKKLELRAQLRSQIPAASSASPQSPADAQHVPAVEASAGREVRP